MSEVEKSENGRAERTGQQIDKLQGRQKLPHKSVPLRNIILRHIDNVIRMKDEVPHFSIQDIVDVDGIDHSILNTAANHLDVRRICVRPQTIHIRQPLQKQMNLRVQKYLMSRLVLTNL